MCAHTICIFIEGIIQNKYDYRFNLLKVAAVVIVILHFSCGKEKNNCFWNVFSK
jgi:hypothetical protein